MRIILRLMSFLWWCSRWWKIRLNPWLISDRSHKSIIFRREYPQLKDIIDRSFEIIGHRKGFNGQANTWRLPDRSIEFGAVQYDADVNKYQGRAHDLKAFDELPNFTEFQYRFLIGWNRTTKSRTTNQGYRCRQSTNQR